MSHRVFNIDRAMRAASDQVHEQQRGDANEYDLGEKAFSLA
jgi:hypothetical protein